MLRWRLNITISIAHGDVTGLVNANNGYITNNYQYDAFGNEKNPSGSDNNPFRYCGEYFDKDTGTYYLRARYYDPKLGRFLCEDPIGSGLNWYTYCNSNPVMYVDPTGLMLETVADILTVAGAVITTAIATVILTGYLAEILEKLFSPPSPEEETDKILSASEFDELTTAEERQDAIWTYLTKVLKLDPIHAAAIMGNIAVEAGPSFNSSVVQKFRENYVYDINDSIGYGLLQWTEASRKEGLLNFANEKGGKISDYDIQLEYMLYECTQTWYKTAYSKFLEITNLEEAVAYFCKNIEQPSIENMSDRIKAASRIYNYYTR